MSVLINMEMPTSCCGCFISDEDCELWKQLPVTDLDKVRHKCCPLVPVPEHGRLIDADALIGVLGIMGDKGGSPVVWQQMRYIAEDMPAIIPADEPFGKSEQLNL